MPVRLDDATTRYVNRAQRLPRLSRTEEQDLFSRWRATRDRSAADAIVRAHLRDVAFIALKYRHYGIPVSELIGEGNLGLLRALEKFEPDLGTRFATYAAYWIQAYVVGFVLRSWSLVGGRSGVMRSKMFFRVRRERAAAESLHGPGPEANSEIAERLGVSQEVVRQMLARLDAREVSLDMNAQGRGFTIGEELASRQDVESDYARDEVRQHVGSALRELLPELDEREQFIVRARLASDDALSLSEIGKVFGVSRERARQLEERVKRKLRDGLIARVGSDLAA